MTTDETLPSKLADQQRKWERDVAGAKGGNPFATLCDHCFGRHPPPRNELCARTASSTDTTKKIPCEQRHGT